MPVDSTAFRNTCEPEYTTTYIEKPPYHRPETATERLKRERLEKRRARAVRNNRK